ncbi:IS21 family transposase [Desulforamulus putei]|uniref:IS21 family transposase n=1 Tax=Desulforamulus putei TaxID=74701 RepID=UPI002FDEB07C
MNNRERWKMYYEIQSLKEMGLNVSQIARRLGICRNTVYTHLSATTDDLERINRDSQTRQKKLDEYKLEIAGWLKTYPDLSAAQVLDWLMEKKFSTNVCEGTVRNYIRWLREEYDIPKIVHKRQYEAIEDPPMGHQAQMDFGETKLLDANGQSVRLWFIGFVLAHSRYKYVEWSASPFTTRDVIQAHENAFEYYGGMPKEIVYDQDHLILVSENHGDLILTKEFAQYMTRRRFKIYMCRKQDPETKGRIENVVGFVKKNFSRNRVFYHIDKLNEECRAWLDRTGNGKMHNTIKKIPAQVFSEERRHLTPVTEKIEVQKTTVTGSIAVSVRKNNTIVYKGNRYSVPLGTFKDTKSFVYLDLSEADNLKIIDPQTGEVIARHLVCRDKGKLIKNNNHGRDRSRKIQELINHFIEEHHDLPELGAFLDGIRSAKPRYVRDQLQLIQSTLQDMDKSVIERALHYCLKNRLYSASDFGDAVGYFRQNASLGTEPFSSAEIKTIDPENSYKLKIKPEVRDLINYKFSHTGGV